MKEYLESLGIAGAENLAARLAFSVWVAIDWKDGLWKSAGAEVYNRFESRLRTAARSLDLSGFLAALGRRCHVSVPRLEEVDIRDITAADASEVLRLARETSGLIVATMRLWIEERRKGMNSLPLFAGGKSNA